ncbi:hypothetical protein LPJ66_000201 [Kickxella alabastrina]|uniref:Uncharacterized protein n=1 Tax=Kickxella alabastrina TaxID=61397 RepID=A0ACC1IX11_9FUNG|nr:hypothetical protein LPJ66_000201 [Kickxella alabastrina]
MHTVYAQLNNGRNENNSLHQRKVRNSPMGITKDHSMHQQLLIVDTPDVRNSQSLVSRLAVMQPSSEDNIVVEGKKALPGGSTERSVKTIYQVVGNSTRVVHQAERRSAPDFKHQQHQHQQRQKKHMAAIMQTIDQQQQQPELSRKIAVPRSKLNLLRPTHRQMPSSRDVADIGPVYTQSGGLVARRPSDLVLHNNNDDNDGGADMVVGADDMCLSDSYCDDVGYDLADAEIDSLFCRSFDMDMLPDAPERKISYYNIGVKEVPRRSPTPTPAPISPVQTEETNEQVHYAPSVENRIPVLTQSALDEKRASNIYARMLTMRSSQSQSLDLGQAPFVPAASPAWNPGAVPDIIVHEENEDESWVFVGPQEAAPRRDMPSQTPVLLAPLSSEKPQRRSFTAALSRLGFGANMSTRRNSKLAHSQSDSDNSGYSESRPHMPERDHLAMRISSSRSIRPTSNIFDLRRRSGHYPQTEFIETSNIFGSQPSVRDESSSASGETWGCGEGCWPKLWTRRSRLQQSSRRSSAQSVDTRSQSSAGRQSRGSFHGEQQLKQQLEQQPEQQQHIGGGFMHSLTSSWGHIYHHRPVPGSRRSAHQSTTRVRDVLAFPFRLSYNCFLWWMAPCINIAKD